MKVLTLVGVLVILVGGTSTCEQPDREGASGEGASTMTTRALLTTATTGPHASATQVSQTSTTQTSPTTRTTVARADQTTTSPTNRQRARVVEVVDGDTLVVTISGRGEEKVRLIGIDAPESDEHFYAEAREELARLVSSKTVDLETDVEERDQYGRLLAYVWVGDVLANAEVVRLGVATLYTIPPNLKYVELLEVAQEEAQTARRGMWGAAGDSPIKIVRVNYNAPGDDNVNLNEEYVVFEVLVSGTLLGYSVQDEAGHRYRFPDLVFQKGDVFKLHSGKGTNTRTDLYWGASGSAIWNNSGDTVKVLDPEDRIVASYRY